MWDISCSTAWRSFSARFKKNAALKIAWDAKTPEARQAWFKEQKANHQPSKRRRFDEIQVQEQSFDERRLDEGDIVDWVPFEEWVIRERALNPNATMAEVVGRCQRCK